MNDLERYKHNLGYRSNQWLVDEFARLIVNHEALQWSEARKKENPDQQKIQWVADEILSRMDKSREKNGL